CEYYFCFNDTPTTEIYTLSLHDALPIWVPRERVGTGRGGRRGAQRAAGGERSEEHTSELQSNLNLVCRLLLVKKTYSLLVKVEPWTCGIVKHDSAVM